VLVLIKVNLLLHRREKRNGFEFAIVQETEKKKKKFNPVIVVLLTMKIWDHVRHTHRERERERERDFVYIPNIYTLVKFNKKKWNICRTFTENMKERFSWLA